MMKSSTLESFIGKIENFKVWSNTGFQTLD